MSACLVRNQFLLDHAHVFFLHDMKSDDKTTTQQASDFEDVLYDYLDSHKPRTCETDIQLLFACWRLLLKAAHQISSPTTCSEGDNLTLKAAWNSFQWCVTPQFPKFKAMNVDDDYLLSFENAYSFLNQCAVIIDVAKKSTRRSVKNISIPPELQTIRFHDASMRARPFISYFEWLVLLRSWFQWHMMQPEKSKLVQTTNELNNHIQTELLTSCVCKPMTNDDDDPQQQQRDTLSPTHDVAREQQATEQSLSGEHVETKKHVTVVDFESKFDGSNDFLKAVEPHILRELQHANSQTCIFEHVDDTCAISRCGRINYAHQRKSKPEQLHFLIAELTKQRNIQHLKPDETFCCHLFFRGSTILGFTIKPFVSRV